MNVPCLRPGDAEAAGRRKKSTCGLGLSPLATLSTATTNFRTRSLVSSHLANSGLADRAAANSRTAGSLVRQPTGGNARGAASPLRRGLFAFRRDGRARSAGAAEPPGAAGFFTKTEIIDRTAAPARMTRMAPARPQTFRGSLSVLLQG